MRATIVGTADPSLDPEARWLARSLAGAGHDVRVVGAPAAEPDLLDAEVVGVPWRRPVGGGPVGALVRRVQPAAVRRRLRQGALGSAVGSPDIVYPLDRRAWAAVRGRGPAVQRPPTWGPLLDDDAARRFVDAAPPLPVGGAPTGGGRVVLVHRHSETTPARYLADGFRSMGVTVDQPGAVLDWSTVPADTTAVVVVESKLPAPTISGDRRPDVPVLLWAHHGEHHLATNLRLAAHVGADAVLLAHSWHLAHRFDRPTWALPFAVSPVFEAGRRPWDDRDVPVAMVGSGLGHGAGRYGRRAELAATLARAFPGSAFPADRLSPEAIGELYGRSRVVLNEGGDRHHPITMRVFEAVAGGAALLTDEPPGLDRLFAPGTEYGVLGDDPVAAARHLLDAPEVAAAATARADAEHRYEHRAAALLGLAATVEAGAATSASPPPGLVHVDLDVHRVLVFDPARLPDLSDRAVERHGIDVPGPLDGVIYDDSSAPGPEHWLGRRPAVVYATPTTIDAVLGALSDAPAAIDDHGGELAVWLRAGHGYRVLGVAA